MGKIDRQVIHAEREPLYAGVAHARNIVLHGYVIVGLYQSKATGGYASAAYGSIQYGGGIIREFLPLTALPKIRPNPANETGYARELAGKEVDAVLARVVQDLRTRLTA